MPPWDWEDKMRRHDAFPRETNRRIGSTTSMLIELYLDLDSAHREISPIHYDRIQFAVICQNPSMTMGFLHWIHQKLNLSVNLHKVDWGSSQELAKKRGRFLPSWGVFCDHHVKEISLGTERPYGPFRYIRALTERPVTRIFDAFDRDGNLILTVPHEEVNDILRIAECPIQLKVKGSKNPVVYPAWSESPLAQQIQHKELFA
jgi:hypothetical protein